MRTWPEALREAVATLRAQCPTIHPVRVRLVEGLADRGDITLRNGGSPSFLLRLRRATPEPWIVDLLVHEWAHALSWTPIHRNYDDHGPEFGVAYARCYQAVWGQR